MTDFPNLTFTDKAEIAYSLRDLAEICDSFDQLALLAAIVNMFVKPGSITFKMLSSAIENTAKHLLENPNIGLNEAKNGR